MTRDYVAEMEREIARRTTGVTYNPRIVATEIVEDLRANDVDLLNGWLQVRAENLIWQAINDRDRSTRMHARTASSRSVFREALEASESGDQSKIVDWLATPWTIITGVRKSLGEMTAEDLRTASSGYYVRAQQNAMNASFLMAIAKQVGDDTVAEHYTNAKLDQMWRSLGN